MASLGQHATQDRLHELQALLNSEIPLTNALKLCVASYDERWLRLSAPLAENINHSGTAFAGSLNALVTLAGWSMLWFVLQECGLQGEIVVQDSSCKYLLPVTANFSAVCEKPAANQLARFEKMLRGHHKARLELSSTITESDHLAVAFQGRYVVHLR